jgi:catechol 2,3-dioxygenase-like lactoylglutathione lyase family enzyme
MAARRDALAQIWGEHSTADRSTRWKGPIPSSTKYSDYSGTARFSPTIRSTNKLPMTWRPRLGHAPQRSGGLNVGLAVERFDHIVLNCRDIEATASWYERVLGMRRETFGPSHRTALCFGDQKINLRPIGALADDPDWVTGSVEAAGSEDLCFVTDSAPDEVCAHLAACGVEVISGPVTKVGALGPMTSHYCRDVDGNLIEIAVY